LRQRVQDILPLARHFLSRIAVRFGRHGLTLSGAAESRLTRYSWPGNIRELENIVQRAVILAPAETVEVDHLLLQDETVAQIERVTSGSAPLDIKSLEKRHILEALAAVSGSRKQAAQRLGMSERTLRHKLQQYREEGENL
jgi:two-component system response regulator FlrC